MSLIPLSESSPVLKIGAVVVWADARQQSPVSSEARLLPETAEFGVRSGSEPYRILILQPIPKRAGEVPAFVLPRGSRQYRDVDGQWHDARDVETGEKYAAVLEPFARGLAREIEEEAGVDAAMLARAKVHELGRLEFQSRSKGVYPIHWFVVRLAPDDAATLTESVPADALSVRWATLDEIKALAARGEFSAGYIPVIEAALRLPD